MHVWLYVCCMITVGVLILVASCVWFFLLGVTILSTKMTFFLHDADEISKAANVSKLWVNL